MTEPLKISDIALAARNQWQSIFPALGITVPVRGKHGACPVCGGKDRFHFDDKEGRGTWICRQCDGKQAGDGLDLVCKATGKDNKAASLLVAQVLGLSAGLDMAAIKANEARAKQQAEQERQREQAKNKAAAELAHNILNQCQPAKGHPYLVGKGLAECEAFILQAAVAGKEKGLLVIPLYNSAGELTTCQTIDDTGHKYLLSGGRKEGSFHRIAGYEVLAICEGYATGLSIHRATGFTVYCAIDAGNLRAVAESVRAQHPQAKIILAADNDADHQENIGLLKAQAAADAIGGVVVLPPISGDWNDYHQQYGRDLTREAILMSTKQSNVVSLAEAKPQRSNTESSSTLAQMAASQRAELLAERLGHIAVNPLSAMVYVYKSGLWQPMTDDDLCRVMVAIYQEHKTPYSDKGIISAVRVLKMQSPVMGEQADHLVGFANGVYDIKSGSFRQHSPDDWLLNHNGIEFTAPVLGESITTHAPNFSRWLSFAAENNTDKMERIKAALFMILAGRHDWQLFLEITGQGGSGKSVFSRIAELLVGYHNIASGNTRSLDEARGRYQFVGKRLIVLPDQPKYVGDGSGIKAITGGDLVEIDGKYEKQFSAVIKAVILITNNDPMVFTERNGGIARRRVIFNFDRVVSESQKDPQLGDKIAAELPVIIRHLLNTFRDESKAKALLQAQRDSSEALAVKRATDPVLDMCAAVMFMETATGMRMGGGRYVKLEPRTYLYHLYLEYMEFHGLGKPLSVNIFSTAVRNAAKEYGKHYLTRKVKGLTHTNVQTTELVNGFLMTLAAHEED
jgi:putative DNA primase/helicase